MESPTAAPSNHLRFKLRILTGALFMCVIPLLVIAFILPKSITREMRSTRKERLARSAQATARLLESEFAHDLAVLTSQSGLLIYKQVLSEKMPGASGSPAMKEVRRHLAQTMLVLGDSFQEVFLCDSKGTPILSLGQGGKDIGTLRPGMAERRSFKEARDRHVSHVSRPEVSILNKVPVVYLTAPILDEDGSFLGVLGLVMEFDHLSGLIVGNPVEQESFGFAVDDTGMIVVHPNPEIALKLNINDVTGSIKLGRKMLKGLTGTTHYQTCTGEPKVAAFAPVPCCGWSVGVSMPENVYNGAGNWIRRWVLLLSYGCAIIVGLGGIYVAHSLARKHEALQSLSESRECFFKAFVNAPHALLILRASDRSVLEMNSAFGAMFKIQPEAIKGKTGDKISFWANSSARGRILGKLEAEGSFKDWETEIPDASGSMRHCILSVQSVYIGNEECYLVQLQDNTRAKQAEEAQLMLQSQLMQAQKVEALGQLSGGVAHDFNNILAALQLQISFLASNESLSEHGRKLTEESMSTIESGSSLTKQLLQFSRRSEFLLNTIDVRELINGLGSMLQRLIGCRHRLELNLSTEPLVARIDAGKIQQVLLNLVINARDAMPDGGCIRILAAVEMRNPEPKSAHIVIQVLDEGTGMSEETKSRLFEPFFTTKQPGRGTGLGLSTTFRIVKEHRGSIEVESELGKGTCFKVILPVSADQGRESVLPSPAQSTAQARGRGDGICILYVEDEIALRHLTSQIMSRQGYTVLSAKSASEALEHYHKAPAGVNLLVTDIMLPGGMLGTELAVELRKLQPDLPVIFTSGVSLPLMPSELSGRGIQSLPKPFRGDSLLDALYTIRVQA